MFNAEKPNLDDLPSTQQLLRSTAIAAGAAGALLLTVVLPAEYAIDPTGMGRLLGLTEMGEIKQELYEERQLDQQSSLMNDLMGVFVGSAEAQEAEQWSDEITFSLTPGQGIEWKLEMTKDAIAQYRWYSDGGRINYDLHGDGSGNSISYEKGRGQTGGEGDLRADFDGNHGWFFRNRDRKDVVVTLQLRGDYTNLKQTY